MEHSEAAGSTMLNAKMNGMKRKAMEIGGVKTTTRRNGRLGENGVISGSPCGACKLKKKKCSTSCIYAPYFSSDDGSANFAAVNKLFGASNLAKLLSDIPQNRRQEAVDTICSQAQARLVDPVFGCVENVRATEQELQQQADALRKKLETVRAQVMNARRANYQQQQQHVGLFQKEDLSAFPSNSNLAGGGMNMSINPYWYSGLKDETLLDTLAFPGMHYENESSLLADQPFENLERMISSIPADQPDFPSNSNLAGGGTNMRVPSNSLSSNPYGYSGLKDETLTDPAASHGMHYENESSILALDQLFENLERMLPSIPADQPAFPGNSNIAGGGKNMRVSSNSLSSNPYGYSGLKDETLTDPAASHGMHYENESSILADQLEHLERMIPSIPEDQPFEHLIERIFPSFNAQSHG